LGGGYYHDASACLVEDGLIVAFAEEERFSRRKHHRDSRSASRSAAYCLGVAGIRLEEVSQVVIAWNPGWPAPAEEIRDGELIRELLDPAYFGGHVPDRFRLVDHHLAHAASAFYCSGFEEAAIVVVDGSGDGTSTSTWRGTSGGLHRIREYPFTDSLGWFYETVAEHVGLGDWTSSGKLMGLAAYGNPVYDFDFLHEERDGFRMDLGRYGLPDLSPADYLSGRAYGAVKAAHSTALEALGVPRQPLLVTPDPYGSWRRSVALGQPQMDLAASAQSVLERCVLNVCTDALRCAGSSRLCLAGGVALNCAMNGVLWRRSGASHLFVQPVAGDAGCAIGAALATSRASGMVTGQRLESVALGPSFSDEVITNVLDSCNVRYQELSHDRLIERLVPRLREGSIVGWFQGALEAGPRALGHRSILADPRSVQVRDRVNREVKAREAWRPLAPSLLESSADRMLEGRGPSEFMIVACRATDAARAMMPGTVHVDGSVRPHVVSRTCDPLYADVIASFSAETDVGALLNTSFNVESEPIVCSPLDALRTFYGSGLDLLVMGNLVVDKDGAS
jgi:carbamoyltransferase